MYHSIHFAHMMQMHPAFLFFRFMKPCLIVLHGPFVPYGDYWNYLVQLSPNIVHVRRERPTEVFGNTLKFKEHSSDVMRIQALMSRFVSDSTIFRIKSLFDVHIHVHVIQSHARFYASVTWLC